MTNTDEVPATCPYDISFDLTNRDGSPILGSVFTWTGGGTQTIGTFTNDKTKIGVYPMRLHIKYFQHDQLTTNYYDFDIEIVDPCLNNAILIPEPQTDPPDYYYTGMSPSADFLLNPFIINPPNFCTADLSCAVSSGPRTDLCDISDGLSMGMFTPTGDYTFVSFDNMDVVVPGDYVFDITATVGVTVETV